MSDSPSSDDRDRDWKPGARFILILVLSGFMLFGLVLLANADTARERWSCAGHVGVASMGVAVLLPSVFQLDRATRIVLMLLSYVGLGVATLGLLWG